MKLYIWTDPYLVPYGSSMVFAVAENLRGAKKLARTGDAYSFGKYEQSNAFAADFKLGKPTRVLALPCAEWHEWSE